jgi:hypothetical protein
MKLNGNKIRSMINITALEIESYNVRFQDSLRYFKGETIPKPHLLADKLLLLEQNLAILQTAQKIYNTKVKIDIEGLDGKYTLEEAVKLMGVYNRMKKIYKKSLEKEEGGLFGRAQYVKNNDEEIALYTLNQEETLEKTKALEAIRQAIMNSLSDGNSQYMELETLDRLA